MKRFEIIFLGIILLIMLVIGVAALSDSKLDTPTRLELLLTIVFITLIVMFGYLIIIGWRIKKYLYSKKLETPNTLHSSTQVFSQKGICPRCKTECDIEDGFCMQCGEKLTKN